MASTFPSVIATLTNPTSGQTLNSPSHSTIESNQNNEIMQIETVIGTASSTIGTIIGDLRNSTSGGGGHVQTAQLGGTGLTSYTKGDILAATSSSSVTNLAVGTDNQVLTSDSTQAAGIKWGSPTLVGSNSSIISIRGVGETSILNITIPSSVMGSANVMESTMYVDNFAASGSVLLKATFGGAVVSSVLLKPTGTLSSIYGKINYSLFANGINNQRGIIDVDLGRQADPSNVGSVIAIRMNDMNISSVATATNKTMGMTVIMSNAGSNDHIDIDASLVRKIL